MMRFTRWALCLSMLAFASDAAAESLPILDRTIRFEPPAGYCLFDRADPYESQMFDYMAEIQQANGIELLAAYAVCGETDAVINGQALGLSNYGLLVALPGPDGTIGPVPGYARERVLTEMSASMPRASAEIADGMEMARQQLAERGVDIAAIGQPTIVARDDNALYAVFSLQGDAGQGPVQISAMAAFTFLQELPLANYLYAPADGDDVFDSLHELQVSTMADLVAANE